MPSLKESIFEAVKELSKALGVNSIVPRAEAFVISICKDPNRIAIISIGRGNLIWTRERDRHRKPIRKLVYQTPEAPLEVLSQFEVWKNSPQANRLREEGIGLELSSRTHSPEEIIRVAYRMKRPVKQ